MADVTDLPGPPLSPGEEVTILGYDGDGNLLSAQEAAALAGANEGCGITTAIPARVGRVYL